MVRRRWPDLLCVAATAGVAVSAALPWARTGRATRSAFALARTADEIGVLEGPGARVLFIGLAFLPAMVAGAWLAAVLRRRRALGVLAALAGLLAVVGAVVVWDAPVEAAVGPAAGAGTGTVALLAAAATALPERKP